MQSFSVNSRAESMQLVRLVLVVMSFFFLAKIGYSNNLDELCRSAPLLIDGLEIKTNGLTELGSACYGSGESLKIRVSVAISPGHEHLVREKFHLRELLKSICETEELYELAKRIPIVWTYYTIEGTFYSEFPLNMNKCEAFLD